jgi:hypothetical protein
MGTEVSLDLAGMTVSWSKNSMGMDHGDLFQESDRWRAPPSEDGERPTGARWETGFYRPLRLVLPRLELLGYTLDRARRDYERAVLETTGRRDPDPDDDDAEVAPFAPMTFEAFCAFVAAHPVRELNDAPDWTLSGDEEKRWIEGRFAALDLENTIPHPDFIDVDGYSERSYFGSVISFLPPYTLLRLLAENPANLDEEVTWGYGSLVENGWATESQFRPAARRKQTFLIATEGSSDTHILKHAFALLRPDIEDFFRFIDVSERHPFSGTGNLLKFAEGLAKIDVHNQVVFLFDNDAEGLETYRKVLRFQLPANMRAMMLPELDGFRSFPAHGPDGLTLADINRSAAAIECYLDLTKNRRPPAAVRWTNYKSEISAYQGALEYKDTYVKAFLRLTAEQVEAGRYDTTKMRMVLEGIAHECSLAATALELAQD